MWIGACISSIGTWTQQLAQAWLVYEISGSSRMLGLDAFLGQAPIMLFSLLGGVAADRIDRRHILLVSQVVQMATALTLAALVIAGAVEIWHILCLSFIVGLAQAFGSPAYSAFIPSLVKPEDLPNAIAMNSIQFNLARIIGPAIGGIVLTEFGAAWCFGLNGMSFIAVIITLILVRSRYTPKSTTQSVMTSMKIGFSFVRTHSVMLSLMVLAFLLTYFGAPLITFLPVFADMFTAGVADVGDAARGRALSILLSTSGAGSVAGAVVVAALGHTRHKGMVSLINTFVLGILIIAFAMSPSFWLSCVFLFVASAALMSVFTLVNSLVQLEVTDEMRGRVMSVYNMAFRGGMPIGNYLSGELIERTSVAPIISANGVLMAAAAIYFFVFRRNVGKL
jgi:MFS family permease